jgi:hypothetical protein
MKDPIVSISLPLSEAVPTCAAILGMAHALKFSNMLRKKAGVTEDLERLEFLAKRVEFLALLLAAAAQAKLPDGMTLVGTYDDE